MKRTSEEPKSHEVKHKLKLLERAVESIISVYSRRTPENNNQLLLGRMLHNYDLQRRRLEEVAYNNGESPPAEKIDSLTDKLSGIFDYVPRNVKHMAEFGLRTGTHYEQPKRMY